MRGVRPERTATTIYFWLYRTTHFANDGEAASLIEVLRGTGTAADVVVWTNGSFAERLRVPASLPSTVEREGKQLYAA